MTNLTEKIDLPEWKALGFQDSEDYTMFIEGMQYEAEQEERSGYDYE